MGRDIRKFHLNTDVRKRNQKFLYIAAFWEVVAEIYSRKFETVGPFIYPDDDVSRIPYNVSKLLPHDKTPHSRRQHLSSCRLKITHRIFK